MRSLILISCTANSATFQMIFTIELNFNVYIPSVAGVKDTNKSSGQCQLYGDVGDKTTNELWTKQINNEMEYNKSVVNLFA